MASRPLALAACAALILAALPVRAARVDPRLRALLGRGGIGVAAVSGAPGGSFRVLIRVAPGVTAADLRASFPAESFGSESGGVVTATLSAAAAAALAADARVLSLEAARRVHPTLDIARSNQTSSGLYLGTVRNTVAADLANANGQGVVVGVVDSGVDFRHADFIDGSTGKSRIQYLWDQTDSGGPAPSGVSCSSDCGTEWTNAQLNASIPSGGSVREQDLVGHGTHVTSIAAGNGRAGTPGTYTGFAPKADIIFVKTDFTNAGILDGVNYIVARARALGERAVINLSLGSQMDPHDGTSNFDVGVAGVAASTPVVVAMGNDGTGESGTFPHARATAVSNGTTISFAASAAAGTTGSEMDFWTGSPSVASQATFTAKLYVNGTLCLTEGDGAGADAQSCTVGGTTYSVYLNNDDSNVGLAGGDTTTGNDREVYAAVVDNGGFPASVTVTVALTCTSASGCGTIDGFVDPEGENTNFVSQSGYTTPATLTMSAPATANSAFAVGSYASRISWTDAASQAVSYTDGQVLGQLSLFSGQGPTRDGRQKPDVAAPGEGIGAALATTAAVCSTCTFNSYALLPDGYHAVLQGTSMATPVVTGILATRLQGNPALTVPGLRAILQGLARSDSAATAIGALPNTAFGYGKVAASPQPVTAPSGLLGTAQGTSSITWTWSASVVGADAYAVAYATNSSQIIAAATNPPFDTTGLLPNATYGIEVFGESLGANGPGAFVTTATYASAPGVPTATGWSSSATISYAACPAFPAAGSCSGYFAQVSALPDFSVALGSETVSRAVTALSVAGLASNAGYYARLGYLNPLGAVTWGPSTTFNTATNLVAPANPTFDQFSTDTIRFNWTQSTNPNGLTYTAQASTAANFSGTVLTLAGTALSETFVGLGADTSWYFRVSATGGPTLSAGPVATLAAAPVASGSAFPALGATTLTVGWGAGVDQADTLYQADLSTTGAFTTVVSSRVAQTFAGFAGLNSNQSYFARVTAIGRAGGASAPLILGATTTLASAPTLPGQPFSAQAADGFSFSFNASGNPAGTRYLVLVSTDPGFSVVNASSNTASTTAAFTGLLSDQSYSVSVAALNSSGVASAAAVASTATTVAAPTAAGSPFPALSSVSVTAAWAAGTLAPGTAYLAQVSSSPVFSAGFVTTSSTTRNAFALENGLWANTTYYGQVRALSSNPPTPDGPFLSLGAVSTLALLPGVPGAAFPFVGFTSATVAWTPLAASPSSATAEGYLVQLSTDPAFGVVAAALSEPPTASSAAFGGLAYATRYYARVGSLNWSGAPNYQALGSTTTATPPLSSGTVATSGLSLSVPAGTFVEANSIAVFVPPGAFPVGTVVSVVGQPTNPLGGARSNEAGALTAFGSLGIELYAAGLQPASAVRVTISYDPTKVPIGQDERRLNLWRYDPASGQWTLVPSHVDATAHTLTAYTPHFSTFAPFFSVAGTSPSSAQVFPQPWEIGDPNSRYWASTLTFSAMPAGARVRLLTLTGETIFDATASASGVLTWDGNTRYGRRAASGTYYAIIEAGGDRWVRRVVIVR